MRKLLGIQKCDGRTDRPTYRPTRQGVESRVRDYKERKTTTINFLATQAAEKSDACTITDGPSV